jgi:hypothetical protein
LEVNYNTNVSFCSRQFTIRMDGTNFPGYYETLKRERKTVLFYYNIYGVMVLSVSVRYFKVWRCHTTGPRDVRVV